MQWDLFCRVIDNHGDLGVCWRLGCALAARGQRVRLWVDDASALAWMAPQHGALAPEVTVHDWPEADDPSVRPGAVVVEAFGCDPPAGFVQRMAQGPSRAPVWINLEYLTAEPQAERNHRLVSPQWAGPGAGLRKHFFYPGFTARTGGLLREADLADRQRGFDGRAWLAHQGWAAAPGERVVSLFCYPGAPVARLVALLADQPTLLLTCPGAATSLAAQALREGHGAGLHRAPAGSPKVRAIALPWLSQTDYDHLLWACDLNAVRGEDSFVRAQWAGRPCLWHIYPQDDGADRPKLDAFLALQRAAAPSPVDAEQRALWWGWNGWADLPQALPEADAWAAQARAWRDAQHQIPDLCTQLIGFAQEAG